MLKLPFLDGTLNKVETTIGGNTYVFTTKKNSRTSTYSLDVSLNGVDILNGVQLLSGIDIFSQFPEVPLSRVYCVNTIDTLLDPSGSALGSTDMVVVIEDSDLGE